MKAVGVRYNAKASASPKAPSTFTFPLESPDSTSSNTSTNPGTGTDDLDPKLPGGSSNNPTFSFNGTGSAFSSNTGSSILTGNGNIANESRSSGGANPMTTATSEWDASATMAPLNLIPENFDFGAMAPLQPLHDLVFNDLVGMSNEPAPAMAANHHAFYDSSVPWQFEGEFTDDSFWNFMNQYNP